MKNLSFAACLLVVALSNLAISQETASQAPATQYTSEQLQRYIRTTLSQYEMRSSEKPLKVSETPILKWQNSVSSRNEQGVYVCWFDGTRPLAIGSVFTLMSSSSEVRAKHQWISLTDKPLEATYDGEIVWKPTKSTAVRSRVPNAEAPQETAVRRLTQMREIARRINGDSIDPMGRVTRLELLPQPLLRYSVPEEGLIDGAIFAFVVTTDPDILLVLEAVEKGGKKEWEYSFYPCHYWALRASLDDKEVWESKPQMMMLGLPQGQNPEMTFPYLSFRPRKPIPPASDL